LDGRKEKKKKVEIADNHVEKGKSSYYDRICRVGRRFGGAKKKHLLKTLYLLRGSRGGERKKKGKSRSANGGEENKRAVRDKTSCVNTKRKENVWTAQGSPEFLDLVGAFQRRRHRLLLIALPSRKRNKGGGARLLSQRDKKKSPICVVQEGKGGERPQLHHEKEEALHPSSNRKRKKLFVSPRRKNIVRGVEEGGEGKKGHVQLAESRNAEEAAAHQKEKRKQRKFPQRKKNVAEDRTMSRSNKENQGESIKKRKNRRSRPREEKGGLDILRRKVEGGEVRKGEKDEKKNKESVPFLLKEGKSDSDFHQSKKCYLFPPSLRRKKGFWPSTSRRKKREHGTLKRDRKKEDLRRCRRATRMAGV